MDLLEKIFEAGVVGAGGAGFPTHVKLNCKVDYLIINGSECEPLLKTDQYLMKTKAENIVESIEEIAKVVGAKKAIIGLKKKYKIQIESLKKAIRDLNSSVELHLMDNFYPAGDEQILVYEITKRVIPPSGIPLNVGVVVSNIETVANIYRAMNDKPVIHRHVSMVGMVKQPMILKVPIGTLISKCIYEAGGALIDDYSIILGGPMMGKIFDKDELDEMTITKTTGAIIILPKDHYIINRSKTSIEHILNRATSACIQCSYCTDFCPRHLIGHPLKPHKIMRAVAFSDFNDSVKTAQLCCECGVCELYVCPMGLSPKTVNIYLKEMMREKGIKYANESKETSALEERDFRKVPVNRLISRLELNEFVHQNVHDLKEINVSEVNISLKQHIGAPASPVVSVGDTVEKGQLIGAMKEGELGANVHASIDGKVIEVSNKITIKSESFEVIEE
ncbi:4Fe-4S dicluster domain-containing protein [Clostridium sediminicola]|uniref:4Fe-4S dicluster domain-containing protein n=1 Tax=Clostridium sediminicola TaxID=3114879 RepID=UPI0031F23C7F